MTSELRSYQTLAACMTKANAWVSYYNTTRDEVIQHVVNDLKADNSIAAHVPLTTDHDGYDRHGAKSDLYTLCVWTKNEKSEYHVRMYHAEMWFAHNEKCIHLPWKIYRFRNKMQWAYTMHHMSHLSKYAGRDKWNDCYDLLTYLHQLDCNELFVDKIRRRSSNTLDSPMIDGICPCDCNNPLATWRETSCCRLEDYNPDTIVGDAHDWAEKSAVFESIDRVRLERKIKDGCGSWPL